MSDSEAVTEPTLFDQNLREPALESPQATEAAPQSEAGAQGERKRLAEQLDALKRKELELRRALAMADHPELVGAIRAIEARALAVSRAEAKLAQGFSKSEARRREVVDKKLSALRDKRAELDAQIGAFESELAGLGTDRLATFESERKQALEQLVVALGTHVAALSAAGLDAVALIPEITSWLTEIEAISAQQREPVSA